MSSPTNNAPTGKHKFHFVLRQYDGPMTEYKGRYYVEAEPWEGSYYNRRTESDLCFNLSGVLGNKDGQFDWGGSFFERTVSGMITIQKKDIELPNEADPSKKGKVVQVRCELTAKLFDVHGEPKDAKLDLHDILTVQAYEFGGDTYHRLTERKDVRPAGRTLVLCFDGTSNHFSDKNTNVVKLAELLKKDDPTQQMVYYQTGVGTYSPPGLITPVGLAVASAADQGVAWYLYQHVIDGYRFLMQTYRAGDKIALFGFSRGAFTARALAGMLHCVGLLPAHNSEHVSFAYQVYKHVRKGEENLETRKRESAKRKQLKLCDWLDPSEVEPEDFKKTFSIPVVIDFVGVWDTVASVGALWMKEFRWIEYNPSIVVFRQALALDERRGNFLPSLWDHRLTDPEMQDAREVWFRGEHCDVGGGSAGPEDEPQKSFFGTLSSTSQRVCLRSTNALRTLVGLQAIDPPVPQSNPDYSMLSNISLRWMVRQLLQFNAGVLLDPVVVRDYQEKRILETPLANGMAPNPGLAEELKDMPILDDLDAEDIKKNIYDSIGWSPLWNGLEYLGFTQKPMKVVSPARNDKESDKLISVTTRWPNAEAGRSIYFATKQSAGPQLTYSDKSKPELRYPIYIHNSVIKYMKSNKKYTPRATWYGYKEDLWPRIAFTPQTATTSTTDSSDPETLEYGSIENAQTRIKRVAEPGKAELKAKRPLWLKFLATSIGGCAVFAAVWLIAPDVIPKPVMVMLSSFIKSFFWS